MKTAKIKLWRNPHFFGGFLGFFWIVATVAGSMIVIDHSARPGEQGNAPSTWPGHSQLHLSSQQSTVLLFAHPHCPCTRSSLSELAAAAQQLPSPPTIYVVIADIDRHSQTPLEKTLSWQTARNYACFHLVRDMDAIECRRFGANTSGEVRVYSSSGRLVFSGGLTAARNHEGTNRSREAFTAIVASPELHANSPVTNTPVFGCPIILDESQE